MGGTEVYALLGALLVGVILPVSIIMIRENVKTRRQDIITDLENIFQISSYDSDQEIITSFEFVKYKYFVAGPGRPRKDIPIWRLIAAALPLMVLLSFFGAIVFGVIFSIAFQGPAGNQDYLLLPDISPQLGNNTFTLEPIWVFVLAYLGTLLFVMRYMLRAVTNFDLSPHTFLQATLHVLFGIVTAIILTAAWNASMPRFAATVALVILVSFVIGFVPEAGLRDLIANSRLLFIKREDNSIFDIAKVTPIEVVEGIEAETRQRLMQHNLMDIQNLATANPIMLFVETPYGFFEAIDWVAQAQLCAAVGVKAFFELRKSNIRTIFDLDRAVSNPAHTTSDIRQMVGRVIFASSGIDRQSAAGRGPIFDEASIVAAVHVMLDDIHVQRLRQITCTVEARLGQQNRMDCSRCPTCAGGGSLPAAAA